jgi:hypothetical protein
MNLFAAVCGPPPPGLTSQDPGSPHPKAHRPPQPLTQPANSDKPQVSVDSKTGERQGSHGLIVIETWRHHYRRSTN